MDSQTNPPESLPQLDTYDPLRDDLQNFRNSTDATGASPNSSASRFHTYKLPVSSPPTPTGGSRRASLPFLRNRNRTASGSSMTFIHPSPIDLVDHTIEPSERSSAAFARSVIVGDYTIISGSPLRAGAYVVWNCTVETLEGQKFTVIKRYSEFDALREKCILMNPEFAGSPMVKEFLFNRD
ncbi:hypothetical protein ABW20_dc0107830 [Dactylellina cionopaga]|nr:hypothetical protein ABW20_dc0107830 [Dactylellina cionopaga]